LSAPRSPLLNLLSKQAGDEDEKTLWVEYEGPIIEADMAAGKGTAPQLVLRYYRRYLDSPKVDGRRRFEQEARMARAGKKAAALRAACPPEMLIEI
jgi:hypothetical protein